MPLPDKNRRTHRADIMISSTSLDLPDHRKAAIDAVWRIGMYPLAMESAAAQSKDAIQFSLEMVDQAEAYIGIFAHRYGHVPTRNNPEQISITEMEYRRAVERGIPITCWRHCEWCSKTTSPSIYRTRHIMQRGAGVFGF